MKDLFSCENFPFNEITDMDPPTHTPINNICEQRSNIKSARKQGNLLEFILSRNSNSALSHGWFSLLRIDKGCEHRLAILLTIRLCGREQLVRMQEKRRRTRNKIKSSQSLPVDEERAQSEHGRPEECDENSDDNQILWENGVGIWWRLVNPVHEWYKTGRKFELTIIGDVEFTSNNWRSLRRRRCRSSRCSRQSTSRCKILLWWASQSSKIE